MKSPAPLPEDPMTPEFEKLLIEDPYEVSVKSKKERKKTRANNFAICEGA